MHVFFLIMVVTCEIWPLSNDSVSQTKSFDIQAPTKVERRWKRQTKLVHSCSNMVYCKGDLLDVVQRHKVYKDSKTFVDMSQKQNESVTLENFRSMITHTNTQPTRNDVINFVNANFEFINETEYWTPTDYNPHPSFLDRVKDYYIRHFAKELISLWPLLGRKVKNIVKENPTRHSLIPVPEGFIVPGGRFREIYYWDSYWIIKGLLISEMTRTVKGMLTNFIYLIKQFGFIPNGSRLYYINRSQPPLFASMVGLYIDSTKDLKWLEANIEYIEIEINFWLTNRTLKLTVDGVDYQLAHFGTLSNTPRPECYLEDIETCAYRSTDDERHACYNGLKTGAETGWDFSSRWIFDAEGGTQANLSSIDSQRVVPVDLNAILCKSFRLLASFYKKLGNPGKESRWTSQANEWQKNMELFLYNETDGIWYDYDYKLKKQRPHFFASNFAALWAECYNTTNKMELGKKAAQYFNEMGVYMYAGGIPASLEKSKEKFDLPNAWPPLQEYVILGLYNTGYREAQRLANKFANKWIMANMKAFEDTGTMSDKYDAIVPGRYGTKGEYDVQMGFGWTNGVVLGLIQQFCSARSLKVMFSKYLYLIILSLIAFIKIKYIA